MHEIKKPFRVSELHFNIAFHTVLDLILKITLNIYISEQPAPKNIMCNSDSKTSVKTLSMIKSDSFIATLDPESQ